MKASCLQSGRESVDFERNYIHVDLVSDASEGLAPERVCIIVKVLGSAGLGIRADSVGHRWLPTEPDRCEVHAIFGIIAVEFNGAFELAATLTESTAIANIVSGALLASFGR